MNAELLTPADLGALVKLPADRVVRLCKARNWPHVRFGRSVRFTGEQAEQIVAMQTVVPKSAPVKSGQTVKSARRAA